MSNQHKLTLVVLLAAFLVVPSQARADDVQEYGFIYSRGLFTRVAVPGATNTELLAVNNSGQILGFYEGPNGAGAFLYSNGVFDFTRYSFPDAAATGFPMGINDAGQLVGTYYVGPGPNAGYLYTSGTYTSIIFPGISYTWAFGINDSGDVVGAYYGSPEVCCANGYLYDGSNYTTINVPGASLTELWGINNNGQVVGDCQMPGDSTFFGLLARGSSFTVFKFPKTTNTQAFGVNDFGEVVGTYDGYIGKGNLQDSGAFFYLNGEFSLIKPPKSLMTRAYGINNAGVIVGSYSSATKTRPRRHKTRLPD
jgi:uncharacterized membrane protein